MRARLISLALPFHCSSFWSRRTDFLSISIGIYSSVPFINPAIHQYINSFIFFSLSQQPNSSLGLLAVEVSRSHTIRHTHTHTPDRTPLNEWSARFRDRYLHSTQQLEETNIHALSGIRTRYPSNRVAADLCFRLHGHRDWTLIHITIRNFTQLTKFHVCYCVLANYILVCQTCKRTSRKALKLFSPPPPYINVWTESHAVCVFILR
jgi:hypothetical protein